MKNWKLEFVRGFAATLVFLCHIVLNSNKLKSLPNINLISNWGTESVIIFFILSGIVINVSQKKKHKSSFNFFINRIKRIVPIYLLGILLAYSISFFIDKTTINSKEFFGNLFFLGTFQSYFVTVPARNPVMWSLTFEMFFYLIFSLTIGTHQKLLLKIWFLISIICIPFYYDNYTSFSGYIIAMFAFSSIWLIGYFIYEYRNFLKTDNSITAILFALLLPAISRLTLSPIYYDVFKYLIFCLFSIPFFVYCINGQQVKKAKINFSKQWLFVLLPIVALGLLFKSNSLMSSKIIYITIPALALMLSFSKTFNKVLNGLSKLSSFSFFLGSISYAIYIIHFPLLYILSFYIHSTLLYILLALIIVLLMSYWVEKKYQPFVMTLLKR